MILKILTFAIVFIVYNTVVSQTSTKTYAHIVERDNLPGNKEAKRKLLKAKLIIAPQNQVSEEVRNINMLSESDFSEKGSIRKSRQKLILKNMLLDSVPKLETLPKEKIENNLPFFNQDTIRLELKKASPQIIYSNC